jgi:hypothetical protein
LDTNRPGIRKMCPARSQPPTACGPPPSTQRLRMRGGVPHAVHHPAHNDPKKMVHRARQKKEGRKGKEETAPIRCECPQKEAKCRADRPEDGSASVQSTDGAIARSSRSVPCMAKSRNFRFSVVVTCTADGSATFVPSAISLEKAAFNDVHVMVVMGPGQRSQHAARVPPQTKFQALIHAASQSAASGCTLFRSPVRGQTGLRNKGGCDKSPPEFAGETKQTNVCVPRTRRRRTCYDAMRTP